MRSLQQCSSLQRVGGSRQARLSIEGDNSHGCTLQVSSTRSIPCLPPPDGPVNTRRVSGIGSSTRFRLSMRFLFVMSWCVAARVRQRIEARWGPHWGSHGLIGGRAGRAGLAVLGSVMAVQITRAVHVDCSAKPSQPGRDQAPSPLQPICCSPTLERLAEGLADLLGRRPWLSAIGGLAYLDLPAKHLEQLVGQVLQASQLQVHDRNSRSPEIKRGPPGVLNGCREARGVPGVNGRRRESAVPAKGQ